MCRLSNSGEVCIMNNSDLLIAFSILLVVIIIELGILD